MNELEALVKLNRIPYLGPIKQRFLLNHFGSAIKVCQASIDEIALLPGFSNKILESFKKNIKANEWQEEFEIANRERVEIISYYHESYPKKLLSIPDYPLILYMKGSFKPCDQHNLAIVGTRFASAYGLFQAKKIAGEIAAHGFTVTSGLARGVDAAAHEGALNNNGRTVAVIGSGLANIYPKEHVILTEHIAEQGAIFSEFPMNEPPEKQNFPQRNRIVSGMSYGTILIEAPKESGAMLTMDKAKSQGRPTFALPGEVDMKTFKGNHWLIKNGGTHLIEDGKDVVEKFENLFFQPSNYKEVTTM